VNTYTVFKNTVTASFLLLKFKETEFSTFSKQGQGPNVACFLGTYFSLLDKG